MKQYWMLVLSGLCDVAFCIIDTAFSNNVDLDTLICISLFYKITMISKRLISLGLYSYRVRQSSEKNCLILSLCVSIIVGLLVFVFSKQISSIFRISNSQQELLSKLLCLYAIFLPLEACGRFLQSYAIYKGYMKLHLFANITTYIVIVGGDWLSVVNGWDAIGILSSTILSWIGYGIIVFIGCKFWRSTDKLSWRDALGCAKDGYKITIGDILGAFANFSREQYASSLSMLDYAIHSVAIDAVNLAESFRYAARDYAIIEFNQSKQNVVQIVKKVFIPSVLLMIASSLVILFMIHGEVSYLDALPQMIFYCVPFLFMPLMDIYLGYAAYKNRTGLNIMTGVIAIFWRAIILGILSRFGISLFHIVCVYMLDYLTRLILIHILTKRKENLKCVTQKS